MKYIVTIEAEFECESYLEAMGRALKAAENVNSTDNLMVRSVVHNPLPVIKTSLTTYNPMENTVPCISTNVLKVGNV